MDACVGGVVYYLFGYALAYGSDGDGTGNPFTGGMNADGSTSGLFMLVDVTFMEYYSFFFQYVFAATIATIVSGAVAERITFKAYMIYSFILTGSTRPGQDPFCLSTYPLNAPAVNLAQACASPGAPVPRLPPFLPPPPTRVAVNRAQSSTLGARIGSGPAMASSTRWVSAGAHPRLATREHHRHVGRHPAPDPASRQSLAGPPHATHLLRRHRLCGWRCCARTLRSGGVHGRGGAWPTPWTFRRQRQAGRDQGPQHLDDGARLVCPLVRFHPVQRRLGSVGAPFDVVLVPTLVLTLVVETAVVVRERVSADIRNLPPRRCSDGWRARRLVSP